MSLALSQLSDEELFARKRALELQQQALQARAALLGFTQFMRPSADDELKSTYEIRQHHRIIAECLEDVECGKLLAEKGIRFVCISVGPQKGKSTLVSEHFPAWLVGRNPGRHFMFGTYSDSFAWEWGDKVRALMQHPRYRMVFPKMRLRKGSKSKDHMVTEDGGQSNFVGRGGAGAGKPADIFVIDDPVKNADEARSLTMRDATWEWFTRVVFKRMHGKSVCFIISTRWHMDDIIGRLTDPKNPKYTEAIAKATLYINLPSIVDDPKLADLLKVPVGGSIWEERFPLALLEMGRSLDPIGFAALEMGHPTPPEGNFFKRHQIHTYGSMSELPKDLRMYGSCDLALTPEIQADSSVILNAGVDTNDILWILPDAFWDKVAADASAEWLINYCKQYGWLQMFGEKGQIARAIGPFLAKEALKRGAIAVTTPELFPTTTNKGGRALSIRAYMGQGKVKFPSFAPWWARAEDQMLNFTGSGDDLEDDFCDAIALLGQGLNLQIKAGEKPKADNVIRVGTFAWVKAQHNRERRAEALRKQVRGL